MFNKKQITFYSNSLQIQNAKQESVIINLVDYDVVCEQAVKEFLFQVIELYFIYAAIKFFVKDLHSHAKKDLRW
jgi:hypothetical protein